MKSVFKYVGWVEGVSLLLLFFVAMPMKYIWGQPEMVKHVGMGHGVLFLAYVVLAIQLSTSEDWSMKKTVLAIVLSAVPFGTFYFERKYL